MKPLEPAFFERDPVLVAQGLLNMLLVRGERRGRIVEVEAYGGIDDPASHAWRGMTPRTEVMFGPPGRWYVYLSYGIHWCINAVCDSEGTAGAVLLRAIEPVSGSEEMWNSRAVPQNKRKRLGLADGPGKLASAFGIDGSFGGQPIRDSELTILDDGVAVASSSVTTRIGLSPGRGKDLLRRFVVD